MSLDGAKLLFPTSFGYFDPHILKTAEKLKETPFLHCGGLYVEGKHPGNVGSYFGYIDEAQYVAGDRGRHDHQEEQARLHRRQAHPPGPAQHQLLHAGRALGQPQGDDLGGLHRRLVDAGQGGGGRQQPGRSGRRRPHHARRFAQGHRRDRREAGASSARATTPTRRPWRPRGTSPAPSGTGARSTPTTSPWSGRRSRSPTCCAAASRRAS